MGFHPVTFKVNHSKKRTQKQPISANSNNLVSISQKHLQSISPMLQIKLGPLSSHSTPERSQSSLFWSTGRILRLDIYVTLRYFTFDLNLLRVPGNWDLLIAPSEIIVPLRCKLYAEVFFCLGFRWDMTWVWVAVGRLDIIKSTLAYFKIGVEGFELAPKQDSLLRIDQGKNHIFVK